MKLHAAPFTEGLNEFLTILHNQTACLFILKAYPNGLSVDLTLTQNGTDTDIVSVQVVVRDSKENVQAERITEIKSLNQQPGT